MAKPEETTTIEGLINSGNTVPISYSKFSFLERMPNGSMIPISNIIWDYIDELRAASLYVELTDEQFARYKFKPKLLCMDIYGSTEVYFIIMALNDIADVTMFDRKRIRMLKKDNMETLISLIYNAEKSVLENYNSKLSAASTNVTYGATTSTAAVTPIKASTVSSETNNIVTNISNSVNIIDSMNNINTTNPSNNSLISEKAFVEMLNVKHII